MARKTRNSKTATQEPKVKTETVPTKPVKKEAVYTFSDSERQQVETIQADIRRQEEILKQSQEAFNNANTQRQFDAGVLQGVLGLIYRQQGLDGEWRISEDLTGLVKVPSEKPESTK